MNTKVDSINTHILPGSTPKPRFLDGIAKRMLFKKLSDIDHGIIRITDNDETHEFGLLTDQCQLVVDLFIYDSRFYSDLAYGGSIGAGESYMSKYWDTNNLTDLIRIMVLNQDVLNSIDGSWAMVTEPLQKALHWLNRNTQRGSRKNIAAHYDLGNDLFELMLDKTMMYSCAVYPNTKSSLHEAQLYRLEKVCDKLKLKPDDHLLEIGTGWGGLSIYAANNYGCKITTTTISQEQYNLACERIKQEGLEDKITVLLQDYRNLTGKYDKLVSIEMIEAVGHQYFDTYFKQCSSLLKPDGLMLLQAITIADQRYASAKRSVDFIQRYIFPGSCIPSNTAMLGSITSSTDMNVIDLDDIGQHYVRTLSDWRHNVFINVDKLKERGYSDEFLRMWEFYLCYCEGGFAERAISDVHILLAKTGYRSQVI